MHPQSISNACFTQFLKFLIGGVVVGFLLSPLQITGQELNVVIKLKVGDGEVEGTSVIIIENGREASSVSVQKKRLKLDLSFGHQYTIRFEKSGFVTKEVLVDTRNVPLHMREEYLDFGFEIELFREIEYPKLNSDSLKMAQWQYITDYGMFDYKRIDECFASEKDSKPKQTRIN